MRHAVLAIMGLTVLGACSSLLTPSGSAAKRWAALEKSRAAKASPSAEQQICKNMTVMGSNFPQRVCSTEAEWDEFDAQTRQSADDFDTQRRAGGTGDDFEAGQR